ncbi:hypothetical protein B0H13DRAFT_1893098 [Mycena leptocephala]|nr:hypothetical protein B0H13DRAFT_1893098 [Mycena leptocephala]
MVPTTLVLLSAVLLALPSASANPARDRRPPPIMTNVSFTTPNLTHQDGNFSLGPMELGMLQLTGPFLSAFWVPPASVGRWNLVKSDSKFLIEHTQVPGKPLTAVQSAGDIELMTGPAELQKWDITCTTCPPDGFATDCVFQNFPDPNSPVENQVCISNQTIPELGNETLIGDCGGPVGTSLKIEYHLPVVNGTGHL